MVTGGTNTGVMKYVGDALEGYKNPRIGIATWGKIIQNDHLINKEDDHIKEYTVRSSFYGPGAYLDHNHTHFLLVDSGLSQFGDEIKWRSDFEKEIINNKIICNKYLYYFTCLSYDIIFLTFHNGPFILALHYPTYHDKVTLM